MFMKIIYLFLSITFLNAQGLQECVRNVLDTNPSVQQQFNNYKTTRGDISVAQAAYYPKVDLSLGVGQETADQYNLANETLDTLDQEFSVKEYSVTYKHNIFEGFSTYFNVSGEKARTKSAAYAYIEKANAIAFEMIDAYVQQLKHSELLGTANENIEINKKILNKVKKLYKAGLITYSEVNKVNASYSLSLSNYILQENNLINAKYNLARVLGKPLKTSTMKRPVFKAKILATLEKALAFALKNNPSLLVNKYNVESAKDKRTASLSRFYPKIDVEISQTMNENVSTIVGNDDRFKAMVILRYNLFNGFADSSEAQKSLSRVHQETSANNDTRRKVSQELQLAFASYSKLTEQIKHIKKYKIFAAKTLKLYSKEYDLGKRSLLDLLSVQNDLIGAKSQIITVEASLLLAKYSILNSMGTLVSTVLDGQNKLYSNVELVKGGS